LLFLLPLAAWGFEPSIVELDLRPRLESLKNDSSQSGARARKEIEHEIAYLLSRSMALGDSGRRSSDSDEARIRNLVFSTATPVSTPTFLFLGGGTAAGKSTVKAQLSSLFGFSNNHVSIDPDAIMFEISAFKAALKQSPCAANDYIVTASGYASDFITQAIPQSYNVLYDTTMSNFNRTMTYFNLAKGIPGATIIAVGVTVPTVDAAERAAIRAASSSRWVPLSALVRTHTQFSVNFPSYLTTFFPNMYLFDTTQDPAAEIVWKGQVLSNSAYMMFLNKQYDTITDVQAGMNEDLLFAFDVYSCTCIPADTSVDCSVLLSRASSLAPYVLTLGMLALVSCVWQLSGV